VNAVEQFEKSLAKREQRLFRGLNSPAKIQAFLDSIPYKTEEFYQSARGVLRYRKAHCFDGALLAAAAIRRLRQRPLILYMIAENDDGHIIALYKRNNCFGAIAKSNFVALRFREAVYRNLRELMLSYFEVYFNRKGEKTLRAYTRPLNLKAFDRINWMGSNDGLEMISQRLDTMKTYPLLTSSMAASLSPVEKRSYTANMLGVNVAGIYQPPPGRKSRSS